MKAKRCTTHSKIQCSHKESATLSPTPQLSSYFDEYTISQFSWTSFHKTQEELERLRHIGDDVCDNAVAFIEKWKAQEPCQPRDTLDAMFQYLETGKLSKGVESSTAPSAAIVDNFLTKTIPHWVCFAQVERGQHVFWKYSTPHLLDLLFALVGGLGAPRINATLLQTGYISNTTKSQISPTRSISTSFKRLLETTQWVFDAMQPGSLLPGHSGWKSTLRVRILHSKVRTRILSKVNQQLLTRSDNPFMKPVYSIEKHGVPINQEDSVATALVFFYSYIHHFKMRGIHLSSNELKDVLATWRYVSFLMGIEDECNPAVSPEIARGWYESIVIHLVHPDEMSKVMVKNILSSIPVSYEFVVAQFRKTVGDNHADALGLASYSSLSAWTKWKAWVWDWYCVVSVSSFEWPVLVWFKDLRLQLLRRMLVNSTVAILGKRTQFELKHFPIGGGGDARRPDLVNSTHLSTQPYEINVVLPPSAPNRHIYDAHMKSKQNVGGIQPFYDNFIWTLAHA